MSSVPALWTDLGINVLIALASTAVSILIGDGGRCARPVAGVWRRRGAAPLPGRHLVTVVMPVFRGLTHQELWLKVPAYLLGPSLNVLPRLMQTDHAAHLTLAVPLTNVDATHAWLVIGGGLWRWRRWPSG